MLREVLATVNILILFDRVFERGGLRLGLDLGLELVLDLGLDLELDLGLHLELDLEKI